MTSKTDARFDGIMTVGCLIALTVFLLCGCSTVPANKIKLGPYSIETPKNVLIKDFKATVNTNGLIIVEFREWGSTNDAAVISKASAGRVAEINAVGRVIKDGVDAGVSAALKGAK